MIPYLWFDKQAVEAAEFYCNLFPHSKVISTGLIRDTPSGDCETVSFVVWSQRFDAISAGAYVKINPSISFMVNFDPGFFTDTDNPEDAAKQALKETWKQLIDGGQALMELGAYDFSKLYGWVQDRYGVNWQLIFTDPTGDPRPAIMPSMLFVGDVCGKAEEAGIFYRSVFQDSEEGLFVRYPPGMEPEKDGTVMFSDFRLNDTWLTAMDSADKHQFQFNEAVSFLIECRNQKEIDYYWEKLSAVPEAEQCGWLKDRFGVSWQIVPADLEALMKRGTAVQQKAVTEALLQMKKFDIDTLNKAFEEARNGG